MYEELKIILWPDPRLKKISKPVTVFDDSLKALVERMYVMMKEARGVGLAAPQVGLNIRLFVTNPTGEPDGNKAYINPELSDAEGEAEAEEGCLSLPGIDATILRSKAIKIRAQNLAGNWFEETSDAFPARVWQHEFDHLNGKLLMDRMQPAAKLLARRKLRELEEKWEEAQGKKK